MAYIGNIKNKKQARKHLVATGKLPDEYQMKVVLTLEVSEVSALKRAAVFKWPFFVSLICNLYLIWRMYE